MEDKDRFRPEKLHWTSTSSSLASVPVPGDMPAPHLRWQIVVKTGIPEIEWVSMYVPVLAVVEDLDERWQTETGLSFRTINRSVLAHKLHVNPAVNFGAQLYHGKVLTGPEAIFLDTDFFRDCDTWRVHLKIESTDDEIANVIAQLEVDGLIEKWWAVQKSGDCFFANIGTCRLTLLLRALNPSSTTLISLNGAMLYS